MVSVVKRDKQEAICAHISVCRACSMQTRCVSIDKKMSIVPVGKVQTSIAQFPMSCNMISRGNITSDECTSVLRALRPSSEPFRLC